MQVRRKLQAFSMPISTLRLLYGFHTMQSIKATERRIKLPCTVIHSVILRNNSRWGLPTSKFRNS